MGLDVSQRGGGGTDEWSIKSSESGTLVKHLSHHQSHHYHKEKLIPSVSVVEYLKSCASIPDFCNSTQATIFWAPQTFTLRPTPPPLHWHSFMSLYLRSISREKHSHMTFLYLDYWWFNVKQYCSHNILLTQTIKPEQRDTFTKQCVVVFQEEMNPSWFHIVD